MATRRGDCFAVSRQDNSFQAVVNHATSSPSANKIFLTVLLEGAACHMEVDTGSSRSLIAWSILKRLLPMMSLSRLKPCPVTLRDYQGKFIPTLGVAKFQVSYESFTGKLPLIVVKDDLPCLLGLDWFAALHLTTEV